MERTPLQGAVRSRVCTLILFDHLFPQTKGLHTVQITNVAEIDLDRRLSHLSKLLRRTRCTAAAPTQPTPTLLMSLAQQPTEPIQIA
jgi:hypothetical protein